MTRYKCVAVREDELWLTIGKEYYGEVCVSPRDFAGWIEVFKADDNHKAYVPAIQMKAVQNTTPDILDV